MNNRDDFENKINDFVKYILPNNLNLPKVRDEKIIHDSVWGSNIFYKHEIAINGERIACFIMQSKSPNGKWDSGTKWPESAIKIFVQQESH